MQFRNKLVCSQQKFLNIFVRFKKLIIPNFIKNKKKLLNTTEWRFNAIVSLFLMNLDFVLPQTA